MMIKPDIGDLLGGKYVPTCEEREISASDFPGTFETLLNNFNENSFQPACQFLSL